MPGIADALPTVQAFTSGGAQLEKTVQTGISGALSDYRHRVEQSDELEKSLDPDALKPPQLAPAPQPTVTDPKEEWGSAAAWVAALSGMFVRRHASTALSAMGAVLNAYKQRDQEATKINFENWKVANENAVKSAQYTLDLYKTALAQVKEDRDAAKADVLAVASALKDETTPWIIEHYGIDAFVRSLNDWQTHIDRMDKAGPQIMNQQIIAQAKLAFLTAHQKLIAAQQSKDPAKLEQAQQDFQNAWSDLQGVGAIRIPGGAGGATGPADKNRIAELKDAYDKSVSIFNTALPSTPDRAEAKKNMETALRAYQDAVSGDLEESAPKPTGPAKRPAKDTGDVLMKDGVPKKKWIEAIEEKKKQGGMPRDQARAYWVKIGGDPGEFDKTIWPPH